MFGVTIIEEKNLTKLKGDLINFSLKLIRNDIKVFNLESKLKTFESKEFRKKELEQYFAEARLNKLIPREHLEISWKEYESLFQKESCETNKRVQEFNTNIAIYKKNKESLLKSVKEILDWYKSEELQFTPESKNDIKDMFLNLEIAYKNMIGTFGEHKSDSDEIIKEI